MSNIFSNIYGHAKTASGESISLDEISASDFLHALNDLSVEEFINLAAAIESQME